MKVNLDGLAASIKAAIGGVRAEELRFMVDEMVRAIREREAAEHLAKLDNLRLSEALQAVVDCPLVLIDGKAVIQVPARSLNDLGAYIGQLVREPHPGDALRTEIEDTRNAIIALLDGLDSNGDPERCGLDDAEWEKRIAAARKIADKAEEAAYAGH